MGPEWRNASMRSAYPSCLKELVLTDKRQPMPLKFERQTFTDAGSSGASNASEAVILCDGSYRSLQNSR